MASRTQSWLPFVLVLGALSTLAADSVGQRSQGGKGGGGGGGGSSARSAPSGGGGGGSSARSAPSGGGGGGGGSTSRSAPSGGSRSSPSASPRESAPVRQSAPARTSSPVTAPVREAPAPVLRAPASNGRSTKEASSGRVAEEPSRPYSPSARERNSAREPARSSGADSSGRVDSGGQSASMPSRVYDSARRKAEEVRPQEPSARPSRDPTSTGSTPERDPVDFSKFGSRRAPTVPSLSTSSNGVRPVPQRPETGRVSMPVRTAPLTREGLLERYRAPKSGPDDIARARERSDKGLSRTRGAASESTRATSAKDPVRRDPAAKTATRIQQAENTTKRLERLDKKDPVRAKQVLRTGEALAVASDTSLRLAIGVSFGATGGGTGWCWWDPCNRGYGTPAQSCYNSYGPCSWWWWNNCTYWLPSWGWGVSFGASWSCGNYAWSTHPYYCYPGYNYWGCSPWWYAGAIYVDDYYPPQEQVVVVHEYEPQPEAEAPAAPEVQRGEAALAGGNLPPEKRDPALAQALARSSQQYVALGDLAFSERRFGDAVSHYAKAIEYAPDDAVLYMLLSDALFATGDYHYAASALRKSLELEPRLVDTIVDKHAVYSNPQDFENQLGYLEQYLKDNVLDEDARLVLGANYLFGNKPRQALELLQSSFSLEVRKSPAGTLLFDRAQHLAQENPFSK